MEDNEKTERSQGVKGVLLLAFGGGDSLEDVAPFVSNVLRGRPVPPEFLDEIRERYRQIGGSSPLLSITKKQAEALEALLARDGRRYKVFVGMLNWHPFIKDAILEMKEEGIEEAVAVIMAPHATEASTGGYRRAVREALGETGGVPKIEFAGEWHTHPLFIEAVVEKMREALKAFDSPKDAHMIFTAHSLPKALLANDPYVRKIHETVREITDRINFEYRIAFQSKGRGDGWLGPEVEEIIIEASALAKEGVLIVPVGFVADHVETLYDIDILYKEKAESMNLRFARSPSLNDSPKFIEMLADVVRSGKRIPA